MKTKLLLICVLSTFNLFAQTNLVPNGGFETWINSSTLSGWTSENNVTQNTQNYSQGSNSAKLTIANSTTKPKILAQVPMAAGTTYTVKFKYKYLSSNYGGSHPISLKIEKEGSAKYISSSYIASNNDWTLKETTFTADQNISYDLSFSVTTFDDEGFEVLIDDVQVYIEGTEQYTLIPDLNFEKKLIEYKIDSGEPDGKVLTNSINKLTFLNVALASIGDLTGIQDFVSLTDLDCTNNALSTLNVSKNVALTTLKCGNNTNISTLDLSKNLALTTLKCYNNTKITAVDISKNVALTSVDFSANKLIALDVSKNTALKSLELFGNQITALDVSKNVSLTTLNIGFNKLTILDVSQNLALVNLSCYGNLLTTLDLSKNSLLTDINCINNKLTSLNVNNGNNTKLVNVNFKTNTSLSCIKVDDDVYSNTNWSGAKDATATYSKTGCTLGVEDSVFNTIAVYPNPTKGDLHIDNSILKKVTVYDALGKLIKTTKFAEGSTSNTINLAGLPKGIYYIYLENERSTIVKKIIVE